MKNNNYTYTDEQLKKYRPLPFWSWNDKLTKEKLISQIDWMKSNDIGGFFMHARSGLKTEYLSEEWMKCVDECEENALKNDMDAWVYDENGWPSGFGGGKLLENIENHDRYLTYSTGVYDQSALVSYKITEDSLIRAFEPQDGTYLNIYEHYSTSTADILNPDVVRQFIDMTHEAYKKRYGQEFSKKIKGFFTDEPQYYRWETPYSKMILKYFKDNLHKDILDELGLLFVEKKGYREFRYQYWKGMQFLLVNNFAKQIYDWCEENDVKLTGHYIEECCLYGQMLCCGGIMPLYQYEHIPGIDWLGRYCSNYLAPKQVSSVAHQMGRDRVLCETYACGGWSNSPFEMKVLTEFLFLNGVNLLCNHLLPYSEKGNRVHDHPSHFYDGNPWVKDYFKDYNDYFIKLGALLSDHKENVHIAVLHPIRSAYFDYKRDICEKEAGGISKLQSIFDNVIDKLSVAGIPYHFLDEDILHNIGKIDRDKIVCGQCVYDTLILPCNTTMDIQTEEMIHNYVMNGGKVLILNFKPSYIEGTPYDYEYLESNITFDDILKQRNFSFTAEGGQFILSDRGDILFAINHSFTEKVKVSFDYKDNYNSFKAIDVLTGNTKNKPLSFIMEPGESVLLEPQVDKSIENEKVKEVVTPEPLYQFVSSDENKLVVDLVSYSFDGKNYSEPECIPIAFQNLLRERYKGQLVLRYAINISEVPTKAYFMTGITGITSISINNCEIKVNNSDDTKYQISSFLKKGINFVDITIEYFQKQHVYDVLFGENITESLKNCLVYDSEIEPLIIRGNFGVYESEGFKPGKTKKSFYGKHFFIGKAKTQFSALLDGGYPFFSGKIKLSSIIHVNTENVVLKIPGDWHAAEITVNGSYAGRMFLSRSLDISQFTVVGDNKVEIEFVIGNRNLLGPHHNNINDDPVALGPSDFEFPDYYEEGKEQKFTTDTILIEPLNNIFY